MALSKEKKADKDIHPDRAKELARREVFKNVKSVTPQGVIAKGSVTPTHSSVG